MSDADILGKFHAILVKTWLTARIEKQKRTWMSSVYEHYKAPEMVRGGASVKYVFICKRYVNSVQLKLCGSVDMSSIHTAIPPLRSHVLDMTKAQAP